MKKNKQIIENSIKKTTLLASTIIVLVVTIVIGSILIRTEYNNFKINIKNFKNTLIEREKFYIKTAVENLKSDIEFEKISIFKNNKQRVKNQSIIAYNLALFLYKKTDKLSKKEQINLIKSTIKQISNQENDIHYFILDTKGKFILNTEDIKNEGMNFLGYEDINGTKFINKMINASKNQQTYTEYYWFKADKKLVYSRHLKELGIIIGSSGFVKSRTEELKNRLLQKIILQNFNEDEFLFVYKINSLNNITNQSNLLIERNINTSLEELKAIKTLMMDTNYKGGDYILYNKNLFYGIYLPKLRYLIAIGVDLSYINTIVEKKRKASLENMNSNVIKLIIIMSVITIIFFLFSLFFTKKIEKLFSEYQKRVKQNEEKYALLFNYSNDGFIISEILKEDKTIILSLNSTALKITGFTKYELLYEDFFSLFINLKIHEVKEKESLFKTVKLKNKLNEIRTIELNVRIYTYETKDLLFASLRDITERTLLKEEKNRQENILIQKSKMAAMGEMIGNIAHQWRQPLSQISGLFLDIELAYDFKELDKKYLTKRIDEANDLLEYMSRTIDDFRNFFNPTSKKEEFQVYKAVENAVKIVSSTLKYHNIDIQISCDKKYKINGYKNEYSQAIVNIVSNAKDVLIHRNIKNPKIKIYIKDSTQDKIVLCIEDNAGGIESNIINRIFEPYFTTKREYGTGIGLYMTKLIIEEKMNGKINVKNTKDGAVFSIIV